MLYYRFPGKTIVHKKGTFVPVEQFEEGGFIISSFDKKKCFQFFENQDKKSEKREFNIVTTIKADYLEQGAKLVNAIRALGLQKTVLSRIHSQDFDSEKSFALFELLEKTYPNAFVYYFEDDLVGNWLGASPEILFQKQGNSGFTVALAATKKANDVASWNSKEIAEQAFVTDFIQEKLTEIGVLDLELMGPYEHQAGPVKHLKTDFSFSIENITPIEILDALHPTPAVSGLPQNLSIDLIESLEIHNRDLYAGYIGVVDENQASVYVNLRCAQIQNGKIHLYLGGGYTKDSDPELEWIETENKSKTILDLIQKL